MVLGVRKNAFDSSHLHFAFLEKIVFSQLSEKRYKQARVTASVRRFFSKTSTKNVPLMAFRHQAYTQPTGLKNPKFTSNPQNGHKSQ